MDIKEIRNLTEASKNINIKKFGESDLCNYLNSLIKEKAKNGLNTLAVNYYGCKYNVYHDKYQGPFIEDAIAYYNNEGYSVKQYAVMNPCGDYNTCLEIAW